MHNSGLRARVRNYAQLRTPDWSPKSCTTPDSGLETEIGSQLRTPDWHLENGLRIELGLTTPDSGLESEIVVRNYVTPDSGLQSDIMVFRISDSSPSPAAWPSPVFNHFGNNFHKKWIQKSMSKKLDSFTNKSRFFGGSEPRLALYSSLIYTFRHF